MSILDYLNWFFNSIVASIYFTIQWCFKNYYYAAAIFVFLAVLFKILKDKRQT